MKITPADAYEEAKYPELHVIEKRMRRTGLPGKGTAAFAMAVATAMTMTMCGAKSANITDKSMEDSSESTAQNTEDESSVSLAGKETIDESALAGLVAIEETALAGSIAFEETALAGDVYAPVDTRNGKDINDNLPTSDENEANIAGGLMIDEPTETARAD